MSDPIDISERLRHDGSLDLIAAADEIEELRAGLIEARDAAEYMRERACLNEPPNSDWVSPGQAAFPWEVTGR